MSQKELTLYKMNMLILDKFMSIYFHSDLTKLGYSWQSILNCVFNIKLFNHFLHVQLTLTLKNNVEEMLAIS